MSPAFWHGFLKKAEALTGGAGFATGPKGTFTGQLERDRAEGTEGAYGRADGEDTRTDKTLLDRERGPRDFGVGQEGPEFYDDTHGLRY